MNKTLTVVPGSAQGNARVRVDRVDDDIARSPNRAAWEQLEREQREQRERYEEQERERVDQNEKQVDARAQRSARPPR